MANLLLLILVALLPVIQQQDPDPDRLIGFSASGSATQIALETRFDGLLDASNLDEWMAHLTSRPQHVGSTWGRANAEYVADLLSSWGYETEIVRYDVLFPTPIERRVEMTYPSAYVARLDEPVLEEDGTSGVRTEMLPPYNAYSADGDVEAELVYVNYGVPADYEKLERRGISVEGKIVIARYGGSWRGIKPKVAAEHGAIGCILYSDPRDDGYFRGDDYPEGPFRNKWGAQRGSVSDMPTYPGDPLTPFEGAVEGAARLTVEEAPTIMKIPVLPISWGDAQPLLEAMGGEVAPSSWRGALPLTYHLGPGPARVRIQLAFDWSLAPAYNVIARWEGSEWPDEWVIRGNHRDAWVFGAADPTSGMVALLEEARAIAALARSGSPPRRTVIFASWDAEEPGLLGSTEWAEHHADELREKAVAYINTDGSGRGFLGMGGSHALQPFINQVARSVTDPQTGVSVHDRAVARARVAGNPAVAPGKDIPISPLGSGSDYTPFLQHLGISSLNLGFGGENSGGSYHSAYDSYDYYKRFGDPGFAYGIALAQVTGRTTLRLANSDALPFRFSALAKHIANYLDEVEKLASDLREETNRHNALVRDQAYSLAADPTRAYVAPEAREAVPYLNFSSLKNAVEGFEKAASAMDAKTTGEDLNATRFRLERLLTDEAGLPKRPWFRHQIYAPGYYTGYGVKTLPGIREAIEQREWSEFDQQARNLVKALERATAAMDQASNG